jgi:hypothetical protein
MAELIRPGVEVIQTRRTTTPTIVRPVLAPCVVGPAFEVINVLNTDGTINSKSLYGTYTQIGKTITQSSFPDPRSNLDELDIQESTVRPFMLSNGSLSELYMAPGEAFLVAKHGASRATVRTCVFSGQTGLAINGKVIQIAIDNPAGAVDKSKDVVVTFVGSGNLTSTMAAAQINAAVGQTVASVGGTGNNDYVEITSPAPVYGALSSITIRGGGSANTLLGFCTGGVTSYERLEGSGFRGQDDANNNTTTPWIEFYQGAYLKDGTDTTFPTAGVSTATYGLTNIETGVLSTTKATALTYGTSGTVPIQVGDYFYADGAKVADGEISKVESTRFKVGTINTALSTANTSGRYTSKVYNAYEVGNIFDGTPFAPHWTWFKAANLDWTAVSPTAATNTGTKLGVDATQATLTGSGGAVTTSPMTGLTLHTVTSIDGTSYDNVYTFAGTFADMAAVATAIGTNINGLTAANVATELKLTTVKYGRLQSVTVKADGTANTLLGFSTSVDTTATGADVTFPASVITSGQTFATASWFTGGAKTLVLKISSDSGVTYGTTVTVTASAEFNDLNGGQTNTSAVYFFNHYSGFAAAGLVAEAVGTELRIRSTGGAGTALKVDATSTGLGSGKLLFTSGDVGYAINGHTLQLKLSNNPHTYNVSLSDNSLPLAVAEINTAVGTTVAAVGGVGSNKLVLTSQAKGLGASITVLQGIAAYTLGVNGNVPTTSPAVSVTSSGSGRPYPDAYLDSNSSLVLGAEIVRDAVTGYPLDSDVSPMSLYLQFKALRKDVSAVAKVSGVLRISDADTLSSVLDPLTEDNPLGLAMFLCMLNAPNLEIKGLGVDEVTAGAPFGSAAAYTRAAALLESEELYAIAPLSQETIVHDLFDNHVLAMSAAEQGGERIVFQNKVMPIEKNATVALSGTQANSTVTINQLLLDANPSAGLVAAGVNPAQPFQVSDGVYIEFTDNSGNLWRYNVSSVSGSLVNLNTTFTATQNVDAFYSTVTMNLTVINAAYSLKVRGATLTIPGSNPSRLDYSLVASTVADANAAIKNRRAFSVFPDTVVVPVNGIDKELPGFYGCAAIAGMCAALQPQQGFTNYPIAGLNGVKGTEKFSKKQLNVMAGGGTYILIQDTIGGPVVSRHQLSTDLTAIETRELSITKVVDYVAKFLRTGVRRYIGTFVINKDLLDSLSTTVHGLLHFLEDRGVLNGSNINQILQATDQPDTVLIDITLDVPYPCNYIRLTLVI